MKGRTNYPRIGRVSSVFIDEVDGESLNDVFVNVVIGPNQEPRVMKFATPRAGSWFVPSEGDIVEVHDINGSLLARYPAGPPEFTVPTDLTEGDVCFKLNEDTRLHFSIQDDDTVNVILEADGDLNLTVDGDVTGTFNGSLDANVSGSANLTSASANVTAQTGNVNVSTPSGDVIINGVPFNSHTHNYQDQTISDTGDGTGTSSDTTRTTTGPS